jgi:multiple sugar transport system ATP-binding protein
MAGVRKRDVSRRVAFVAGLLGLGGALDARPGSLSGGQRQRVAMGRAIAREPALLLMDEPMSNLDAKLRAELRAELSTMQRHLGATTIYVTHDQVEAMSLGDRVAVMRAGRVVQCAPPTELYRVPVDIFVATFIGSPSMNVVRGVLVADGTGLAVRLGHDLITLDDATADRWRQADLRPGRTLAIGIRPEALRRDDSGQIVVSVEFVERLGSGQLVHATMTASAVRQTDAGLEVDDAPWSTVVVATDADAELGLWKPLRLRVDPADLYVFDVATGAAIRTPAPVGT